MQYPDIYASQEKVVLQDVTLPLNAQRLLAFVLQRITAVDLLTNQVVMFDIPVELWNNRYPDAQGFVGLHDAAQYLIKPVFRLHGTDSLLPVFSDVEYYDKGIIATLSKSFLLLCC